MLYKTPTWRTYQLEKNAISKLDLLWREGTGLK